MPLAFLIITKVIEKNILEGTLFEIKKSIQALNIFLVIFKIFIENKQSKANFKVKLGRKPFSFSLVSLQLISISCSLIFRTYGVYDTFFQFLIPSISLASFCTTFSHITLDLRFARLSYWILSITFFCNLLNRISFINALKVL